MTPVPCGPVVLCGIRTPFGILSPSEGKVAHALLTRPPLKCTVFQPKPSDSASPLDLHVLGTPPAFVLSQDQTLKFNPSALPFSNVSNSQNQLSFFLAFLSLCIVFKVRRSRRSLFILPLQPTSIQSNSHLESRTFTPDLAGRLRALYAQSFRTTLAPYVLPRLLARS